MVYLLATNKYNLKTLQFLISGTHFGLCSHSRDFVADVDAVLGAAPLGVSLIQAVHNKLKSVGANAVVVQGEPTTIFVPLCIDFSFILNVGYGLTEMSPVAQIVPCDQFLSKAGSAGILLPNLEARVVGEGGVDVKPGERGEMWLRGPTVMKVDARAGLYRRTPWVKF